MRARARARACVCVCVLACACVCVYLYDFVSQRERERGGGGAGWGLIGTVWWGQIEQKETETKSGGPVDIQIVSCSLQSNRPSHAQKTRD